MVTRENVQGFLDQFQTKLKIMMSEYIPQTICISFHLAEYPLKYPFAEDEE